MYGRKQEKYIFPLSSHHESQCWTNNLIQNKMFYFFFDSLQIKQFEWTISIVISNFQLYSNFDTFIILKW